LEQGYGQSQQRYDQAFDQFNPYAQQGGAANAMYGNLLGLNGADARDQAQGVITSDPMFQGAMGQQSNALLRQLNARGASGGGQAHLAAQRVLQSNYDNVLNRYAGAGQQGMQAAGAQAGIRTAQGDNAYGYGATRAGNAINYGNAMASAKGIGVNNLLALGGLATQAYGVARGVPKLPARQP